MIICRLVQNISHTSQPSLSFPHFHMVPDKNKCPLNYEWQPANVEMTGMVGLYEICFEQEWKAMKEILTYHGYAEGATGSPRTVLKTAYKAGMIADEELWLSALTSRNNVAHAYNQAIALDIIRQAKTKYYDMFVELVNEIQKNWL